MGTAPFASLWGHGFDFEMIQGFACAETEKIFHGQMARRFPPDIQRTSRRKLLQLHAAVTVRDMAVPPGNRLEALKGSRAGRYSVRINDPWRITLRKRFLGCVKNSTRVAVLQIRPDNHLLAALN